MDTENILENEITQQEKRRIQRKRRRIRLIRRRKKQLLCVFVIVFVVGLIIRCASKSSDSNASDDAQTSDISTEQQIDTDSESTGESAADLSAEALRGFSKDDWNLVLINEATLLTEEATFESAYLDNDMQVDARIYDELTQMLYDGTQTGLSFIVCSAYRSISYQEELFNDKVARLQAEGMTPEDAYTVAKTSIAVPGASEHHLGIAVDIISDAYRELDEQQSATPEYQWLQANCHKYGFIVRYPEGRSDITGFIYEPWHFRYVGVEAATYIAEHNLSLEEFLDLI